jgi:hypothetical protein
MELYKLEDLELLNSKNSYCLDKELVARSNFKTALVFAVIKQDVTCDPKEISQTTSLSIKRVKESIKWLTENYYIEASASTPEQLKRMVIECNKSEVCEWCGDKVFMLHEHHYPIPKREGGEDTVRICPNCHSTFHQLEIKRNGRWS